jgi:hypothetical protein
MLDSESCSIHVACARSAATSKRLEDAECMDEEMTYIPQAYWDDLFNSALSALHAIPVDLELMPTFSC